jgi:hypothetical protein
MTTFYKKVQAGKRVRYEPVLEHFTYDSVPKGAHLLIVSPGLKTMRFNIEPAHAAVMAALEMHKQEILRDVMPAFEPKPARPMSPTDLAAFEAYKKATGAETLQMTLPSASCIFDAMLAAVCKHA